MMLLGLGSNKLLKENPVLVVSCGVGVCCARVWKETRHIIPSKANKRVGFVNIKLVVMFKTLYKFFKASFMINSTLASGLSITNLSITRSDCFFE